MNHLSSKYIQPISWLLIISLTGILSYNCYINKTYWYDEAYTIAMMEYSFAEITDITSGDVHPPLYYYMLKVYCIVFGYSLFTMRFFSLLGILSIFFLALYPIKRLFGQGVSFVFILLLTLLPVSQYLGVEIRMYSWAMFFILACSVYALDTYHNNSYIAQLKLITFGVLGAYIHYYALLSICALFLLLFIITIIKKPKIRCANIIISFFILLLLYSPWLPIFISQTLSVKNSFWIEPLTPKDMLVYCYYFFSPKEPSHPYMIFSITTLSVALAITLSVLAIIIIYTIKLYLKNPSKQLQTALFFTSIYIITLSITFCISFLVRPISMPRYSTCVLGVLILGISICFIELLKNNIRKILFLFCSILLILCIARFFSEKKYYEMKNSEQFQTIDYFKNNPIGSKQIIAPFMSYPALAQLSILVTQKTYILWSPNDHTDYRPFKIIITNQLPKNQMYYLLQTNYDTTHINQKNKTINELIFENQSIKLLNSPSK